ncbi:MAG: MBL fold metallo-hydrolase [Clostridiales Family XIII bacterium]|jgi:glyoxylase-like metal-dependent hydrolase (beta-lactamase superfamily II)|nr:MBL fold metallo-hydrolase [Clostridiales Family XIII bacterium]
MKIRRITCGNLETNCYILYHKPGGEAYIIDPGYNYKEYLAPLRELGLTARGILLTHHHDDHTGAVRNLKRELGCPVYIHREELSYYKGEADEILMGGETLTLPAEDGAGAAAETILVQHTPGHTAGSVCFYAPKSRVSFTGDTIFNVDLGYTHFPGGSAERMRNSIRAVVDKWDNGVTIHPGHGDPETMKRVREVNQEFLDMLRD